MQPHKKSVENDNKHVDIAMNKPKRKKIRVAVLALDDVPVTTVTGPHDVFAQVGVQWQMVNHVQPDPRFEVEIITPDGLPVRAFNDVIITPHRAMADSHPDLVTIPGVLDIEQAVAKYGRVIEWLREQHEQGILLAAICTGSMILAETGLLNGKIATTHWGWVDLFRKRYPEVRLKPDELITDAGDLFCSGAFNSFLDLSIYLVEKLCGRETASHCAKVLIHDIGRSSQAPYTTFCQQHDHGDALIIELQNILERDFRQPVDFNGLAKKHGMSRRTLERRFKKATGNTPLEYLQRVKVEQAKTLLESGHRSFDEISFHVGYEDSGFLRKLFAKHAGLLPSEYRARFSRKPLKNFKADEDNL
ncbi:MAG: helix-turn-helix domain-containing protein [Deltaproteobacteria bacterium]|nr:helix-turn-helix domain-containing protein [Deltaproteobacteria bacterium]